MIFYQKIVDKISGNEFVNGQVEVCYINLLTKKNKLTPVIMISGHATVQM